MMPLLAQTNTLLADDWFNVSPEHDLVKTSRPDHRRRSKIRNLTPPKNNIKTCVAVTRGASVRRNATTYPHFPPGLLVHFPPAPCAGRIYRRKTQRVYTGVYIRTYLHHSSLTRINLDHF
jgi:hypothetical protein